MPAERAGYTVTMFIIDVSPSMGNTRTVDLPDDEKGNKTSCEMSNLEWSLQFVLLKIQEMIFSGRKTEQCGVLLFGTEDTNNIVNDENPGGYENITELIPIGQPNAGTLSKLQALNPSTVIGDPVDAIIVGIETQDRYLVKKKTWTRKMYVITDGENPIELDEWDTTAKKLNACDIIFTVIGIDFDDAEFGFKEEDKSDIKRENEKFFHEFTSACKNGVIGTCAYALQECVRPETKQTKSTLMGTSLRIGDVWSTGARAEEAVEIMIKTSKCTAIVRPVSLKKFVRRRNLKGKGADADASQEGEDDEDDNFENKKDIYAELRSHTDYFVLKDALSGNTDAMDIDNPPKLNEDEDRDDEDDEMNGTKQNKNSNNNLERVDKEELIRGFKYGSTFVPCPDGQFPKRNTKKGIEINGFFPHENLRRDWVLSEVQYVWADPSSGAAQISLSSLIQAMIQSDVVAIARWTSKDDADPKMGVLVPRMMENVDCFLWLQMPFADDIRRYSFPSLEHLTSKKGEPITLHSYLPTNEQMDAMEKFVDAMDLMEAGDKDEEGRRLPWFDPRFSYNPAVHRIKQALFHAAIVQDLRTNPVPPPHPEVIKYLNPPKRVVKIAKDAVEECKSVFRIKEVPKRVATRKRQDDHRLAEDDDDEELLLDILPRRNGSILESRPSQIAPVKKENNTQSQHKGKKKEKMDESDTETEEDDDENGLDMMASSSKPAELHTPARSSSPSAEAIDEDTGAIGRDPGRIIGRARPLSDFKKNIARGDIVTKAVEDLAFVIKDIVMKPFASRRQAELLDCMKELRATCLNEDEIDAWNIFLKDLKSSCLAKKGINNTEFWQAVQEVGREISLISSKEAEELGGISDISESDAAKFIQS